MYIGILREWKVDHPPSDGMGPIGSMYSISPLPSPQRSPLTPSNTCSSEPRVVMKIVRKNKHQMEVVGKLKSGVVHWNHENICDTWLVHLIWKRCPKRCHNSYSTPSWLKKNENTGKERVVSGVEGNCSLALCHVYAADLCLKDATKVSPSDDFLWYTKNARSARNANLISTHTDSFAFFGTCLQLRVQALPLRSLLIRETL